jgi:tetratricopeptide (TPR) repeat protein
MTDRCARRRPWPALVGVCALVGAAPRGLPAAAQPADPPVVAAPRADAPPAAARPAGAPRADAPPAAAPRGDAPPAASSPPAPRDAVPPGPVTADERAELEALGHLVERFEADAADYRATVRSIIGETYRARREALASSYEGRILALEGEQRRLRDRAIAAFEAFVARYPGDARYTPDALFRLSELHFERSYEDAFAARQAYAKALAAFRPAGGEPEPVEPGLHYEATIATMQRLVTHFPDYRLVDGAYYLLGFCLGEQGEEERAVEVFREVVARRPDSRFAAEVWTRIGEHWFDRNDLTRALAAYTRVLEWPDSTYYDKALYKLAWTHYRLADAERAPDEYQRAVDTFVRLLDLNERTRAAGAERGGDLRKESVLYIAISYADERWGGLAKLRAYLGRLGARPFERELLLALAEVYFDQTRFGDAVATFRVVQQRFPAHPEAPAVEQRLVDAIERTRDFEAAARERDVLVAAYGRGSAWATVNAGETAAVLASNRLVAGALHATALFHHEQAQALKNAGKTEPARKEYAAAASAYGEYLSRFSHDGELYRLRFGHAECLYYSLQYEPAAIAYEAVRDSTASTALLEEAAYSAVLARGSAVEAAVARGEVAASPVRRSADRPEGDRPAPRPLAEVEQRLVDASDRYGELFPALPKVPKVLFKAAELVFGHDQLAEARRRFSELVTRFPRDEVAPFAANLVIESYLSEKAYAEVEAFCRDLRGRPEVPGGPAFAAELARFQSGAAFKLAEALDRAGESEQAADRYLAVADSDLGSELADLALNNAAVALEKARRWDSAARLYERLVREHPRSALADTALFRVGVTAERFFDLPRAVEAYERLAAEYPKSPRVADALYNAAVALESSRDYERAGRAFERYCDLFSVRDDAPDVCFRAGVVYAKMGAPRRVVATYERYLRTFRRPGPRAGRAVEVWLELGRAHAALNEPREATSAWQAAVTAFQKTPEPRVAAFAAEARFLLAEQRLGQYEAVHFTGSSKDQKVALTRKAELLKQLEDEYRAVLAFKQIDWSLASLFRIGQLYQGLADGLTRAPCPPDVRRTAASMRATADEVCDEYRVLLEEKAASIEDKAVAAYETAITRARELHVSNRWTRATLVALHGLRGKLWPVRRPALDHIADVGQADAPGEGLTGAALAQRLAREGRLDEARTEAVAALKADERSAPAMVALGMVYRRRGMTELAELALMQASEIDPASAPALHELGMVFLDQGDEPRALAAFERAAAAAPELAAVQNNVGVLRTRAGAYESALEPLERAVALESGRAEWHLDLGNALRGAGRIADARRAYEQAATAGGGTPAASFNLGVLYLDDEVPGVEPLERYRACLDHLASFRERAHPAGDDATRVDEYVEAARSALQAEEKRLTREQKRAPAAASAPTQTDGGPSP